MSTEQPNDLATRPRLIRIPAQQSRTSAPERQPVPPSKRGAVAAWISTLALVAALLVALTTLGSGRSTQEVLAHDLDAAFTYTVTQQSPGLQDGALSVVLTNTSDQQRSFGITVEAVGADGTSLGTDTGSVENLPAGRQALVELFLGRSSEDMAKLKQATFQVVEASAR